VETLTSYARFVEGQIRRRRIPVGMRLALWPPSRPMGPRHTIYEHPITHKFALIGLPPQFAHNQRTGLGFVSSQWIADQRVTQAQHRP
jgi:hypothetical protein